ncbi:MAG TPA: trehalose-6-phosphate synthase [Stellaceae bacterium]|nr:trehalose-6-phosphate synthase [Stellaceae bacterium]
MARLVMVSNRLLAPRERVSRAGGLAIALRETLQRQGGIWFGWSGEVVGSPSATARTTTAGRITYATLDLSPDDHDAYYIGYANSTLWPLCHYRLGLIEFRRAAFRGYQRVNVNFAKALLPLLRPDDIIWVHDYHLIPLGAELRKLGVTNRIGFFLHIPFPAKEVFCALPDHLALGRALTHYDLIGFQTQNDVDAFLGYLVGETGARVFSNGQFEAFGRSTRAQALPIGIDTEAFAETARVAASAPETVRLARSLSGRSLIIGVDRLDYSKGLPRKIEALGELLEDHPEHRGKVTYLQISPSSRDSVAQYRALRREIDSVAGRVNGRYAEFDWAPVRYLNKSFSRGTLAGFYRVARVGFVAPLRDGMNLVAKEYVAAQDPEDPGVLILSRFAGAARELETALIVNPFDLDSLADALHRGLTMPLSERIARWEPMFDALRLNPIDVWCDRFLTALKDEAADDRGEIRSVLHSAAVAAV